MSCIPLDEPHVVGRAVFHYRVDIGGEVWERGDVFYLRDEQGAPREWVFTHYNAVTGQPACCNKQRYGPRGRTVASGFHTRTPTRDIDPQISGDNLRFAQLLGDLRDVKLDELAVELEAAWTDVPASVRARLLKKGQEAFDDKDANVIDVDDDEGGS